MALLFFILSMVAFFGYHNTFWGVVCLLLAFAFGFKLSISLGRSGTRRRR